MRYAMRNAYVPKKTFYVRVSETETVSFIFMQVADDRIGHTRYKVKVFVNARVHKTSETGLDEPGKGKLVRLQIGYSCRYKPGLSKKTTRQMAHDVVGVFDAYIERPDEFDRCPLDEEQVHKSIWMRHMDALLCATSSRE